MTAVSMYTGDTKLAKVLGDFFLGGERGRGEGGLEPNYANNTKLMGLLMAVMDVTASAPFHGRN